MVYIPINGEIMTAEQELYKLNIEKKISIDNHYSIVDHHTL
jgi:hypothetical protein